MAYKYRLSIVVPHYNTPELLGNLLASIPDKDDIQVIVIDDHSDSDAKEKLMDLESSYSCSNILFLQNDTDEHNAGAARNIGLDHAEGEWLLFADADDYFLDGFYEAVCAYFDTDYDIVFFLPDNIELDTGNKNLRNRNYYRIAENYMRDPCRKTEDTLRYSWFAPWSKLIRRSVVTDNDIRFASLRYSNDVMFSVKASFYAKKIMASSQMIYCVSRHAGSLTTHLDREAFDMRTRERIRVFQFLKNNLPAEDMAYTGISRFAYTYLYQIIQRKYGIRYFMEYLRLFIKTGTLYFNPRMLNPAKIIHWITNRIWDTKDERSIKERYEVKECS